MRLRRDRSAAVRPRRTGAWVAAHTPLPITWSVALLFVRLAAGLGLGVWQFGTQLGAQFKELSDTIAATYGEATAWLQGRGLDIDSASLREGLLSWLTEIGSALWRVISAGLLP